MTFDYMIIDGLSDLFSLFGLSVVERSNDHVLLAGGEVYLLISNDAREDSQLLYVGRSRNSMVVMVGEIMDEFFAEEVANFKKPQRTIDEFIGNLSVFFQGKGSELFKEKSDLLDKIANRSEELAREYTNRGIWKTNLNAAQVAWKSRDFQSFIKYVELLDLKTLPSSYQMKYKIALKQKTNSVLDIQNLWRADCNSQLGKHFTNHNPLELRTKNGQLQIEDVIIEPNSSPVKLIQFNKGYNIEPVIVNGKFSTYTIRNKHGHFLGCNLTFVNDKLWKAFIFVAEGNEKSGVTLNLPSHVNDALSKFGGNREYDWGNVTAEYDFKNNCYNIIVTYKNIRDL